MAVMVVMLVMVVMVLVVVMVLMEHRHGLQYIVVVEKMVSPRGYTLCKPCASLTFLFMADQAASTAGLGVPLLFLDQPCVPQL